MSIKNKRQTIKKESLDSRLKSKLKENFDWMHEDDEAIDDSSLEGTDDTTPGAEGLGDAGLDGVAPSAAPAQDPGMIGLADLDPSQAQQLDSEVDELLSFGLPDEGTGDDMLSEDDTDLMSVETPTGAVGSEMGSGMPPTQEAQPVTDFIDTNELQSIIDSPNSLEALENELVTDITSQSTPGADAGVGLPEDDGMGMGLEENEDPFKGISDLPGFEQGYEGVDRKDELMEDVSLASELSALDFEDVKSPLGDDISSTVSDKGIKGGADSNVETESKKHPEGGQPTNIAPAGVMSESVKKSKMLVKAAAAILKLKQMQESAQREVAKLKFENAKLSKVNALLAVAGDKMTKDVRTKIVESFHKCKTQPEVTSLYGKIVNVIKESQKKSLNKVVANTKSTQVKTIPTPINESKTSEVKVDMSKNQMRKNYLMGMATDVDMYYDN